MRAGALGCLPCPGDTAQTLSQGLMLILSHQDLRSLQEKLLHSLKDLQTLFLFLQQPPHETPCPKACGTVVPDRSTWRG